MFRYDSTMLRNLYLCSGSFGTAKYDTWYLYLVPGTWYRTSCHVPVPYNEAEQLRYGTGPSFDTFTMVATRQQKKNDTNMAYTSDDEPLPEEDSTLSSWRLDPETSFPIGPLRLSRRTRTTHPPNCITCTSKI